MRSSVAACLAIVVLTTHLPGAVRGDRAEYVGGTASLKQGLQGTLDMTSPVELVFVAKESALKIPYQNVTSLEFGQKIGRRVGVAVAVTWVALFSKKKRHYLTIGYTERGSNQAAVFELAKDTVRSTLATLEARTAKQVERDDTADLDRPKETMERTRTIEVRSPATSTHQAASVTPTAADSTPARLATTNQSAPMMTNEDVVKMVQAGLSQDLIITAIRNCQPQFSLLPSYLNAMTKSGVPAEVIKAMAAKANGKTVTP